MIGSDSTSGDYDVPSGDSGFRQVHVQRKREREPGIGIVVARRNQVGHPGAKAVGPSRTEPCKPSSPPLIASASATVVGSARPAVGRPAPFRRRLSA